MNKRIRQSVFILLMLSVCVFFLTTNVFACSVDLTESNTSSSGWSYSSEQGHMGQTASTYSYESYAVQLAYDSYVTNGIAMWGNNIAMTYTANQSSATGIIGEGYAQADLNATTSVTSVDSDGHLLAYSITIHPTGFNNPQHTIAGKNRTLAHEIGHAYGLGHVPFMGQIMYKSYSDTKSVTSFDIWGMKVVTHVHEHSSATTGTYIDINNATYHNVICSSCKGIYRQDHAFLGGHCTKCGY